MAPKDEDRRDLVATLLQKYDEGTLVDADWGARRFYGRLDHPSLADQLRPYITDSSKGTVVRRVAVDIAEACKLGDVQDDLLRVILDPRESVHTRVNAAYAMIDIGDDEAKGRLKPLVSVSADEDPNDELKGCGLQAAWPMYMTAAELFAVLTPLRGHLMGAYWQFLDHDPIRQLEPSGLVDALVWVEAQMARHAVPFELAPLVQGVMRRSWADLDFPGVREAFARAALSRVRARSEVLGSRHDPTARATLGEDENKRRSVLASTLALGSIAESDLRLLHFYGLAESRDVPWMLAQLQTGTSEVFRLRWVQLIKCVLDRGNSDDIQAVWELCDSDPTLLSVFEPLFLVVLASPEAPRMKADHEAVLEFQQEQARRVQAEGVSQPNIVDSLLDQIEAGELEAWTGVLEEMTGQPGGIQTTAFFVSELTELPGWEAADAPTRARIIQAAERVVLGYQPKPNKWVEMDTYVAVDLAEYRALELLWREAPQRIALLPASVWKLWAPVIVAYPSFSSAEQEECQQQLIGAAYEHAADEVIATVMRLIDKESAANSGLASVLDALSECWDERIAEALFDKARDTALAPATMGAILSALFSHGFCDVEAFAASLVPSPPPAEGPARDRALIAAGLLMTEADNAGWPCVWPAMLRDAAFGEDVIARVARIDERADDVGRRLTEDQLADLYIWLLGSSPIRRIRIRSAATS